MATTPVLVALGDLAIFARLLAERKRLPLDQVVAKAFTKPWLIDVTEGDDMMTSYISYPAKKMG